MAERMSDRIVAINKRSILLINMAINLSCGMISALQSDHSKIGAIWPVMTENALAE